MGFDLASVIGQGMQSTISGLGDAAIKLRTAITGIDPAKAIEAEQALIKIEAQVSEYQSRILIAEIQGQSWMQRNWRPLLMMVCIFILAEQYALMPFIRIFWASVPVLELPSELWTLINIGVGGYISLRTVEKVVKK